MSKTTHRTLALGGEEIVAMAAGETLAVVDLDSYRTYVHPRADRLDLMVHLQDEMTRLTAFAWDVPVRPLRVRLIATDDHRAMERLTFGTRPPSGSGTVRTYGRLGLVGHDRLLESARNEKHDLQHGRLRSGPAHVLEVTSGIYYVLAYYKLALGGYSFSSAKPADETAFDYTVFFHHYPHPAPRVAPVRLPGLVPTAE